MTEPPDPETAFLEQLGQRSPHMRALRGMSRKCWRKCPHFRALHRQLESGRATSRLVLLRRVSNAMARI